MALERCILCVGRHQRNQELLSQVLNQAGYQTEVALSYEEIMPVVESRSIALILLDITGFDEQVWPVLRSRSIPFFLITAPNRAHIPIQYRAAPRAPIPLLVKPLSIRSLLTLIAHSLQQQP
jgi:CheY-like chemotaxis protein